MRNLTRFKLSLVVAVLAATACGNSVANQDLSMSVSGGDLACAQVNGRYLCFGGNCCGPCPTLGPTASDTCQTTGIVCEYEQSTWTCGSDHAYHCSSPLAPGACPPDAGR